MFKSPLSKGLLAVIAGVAITATFGPTNSATAKQKVYVNAPMDDAVPGICDGDFDLGSLPAQNDRPIFEYSDDYDQRYYNNLLTLCHGEVGGLKRAKRRASQLVVTRGYEAATDHLLANLEAAADKFEIEYSWGAPVHTVSAILEADILASTLDSLKNIPSTIDPVNTPGYNPKTMQVYEFVASLYDIIFYASDYLDRNYVEVIVKGCPSFGGCNQPIYDVVDRYYEFDEIYYQGMQELALKFMQLIKRDGNALPSDTVEFVMTAEVARSTSNVINASRWRRDLRCVDLDILDIAYEAEEFACDPNPRNINFNLNSIRSDVSRAVSKIKSTLRGSCRSTVPFYGPLRRIIRYK